MLKEALKNRKKYSNSKAYNELKQRLPNYYRKVMNDPTHIAHLLFSFQPTGAKRK